MGILILGLTLGMTCKKKNQPPGAPSIPSGPVSGRKGDSLRFSTTAEDSDGDSVAVRFDWGDSTMSDWSAPVPNGDSVTMTHAWQRLAIYSIRAQTRDTKETASVWSAEHQLTIASFSATFGGIGDGWGNSVQQTSDGGYIITGFTDAIGEGDYDLWLIKTDASGNKAWDRAFGGPDEDRGNSVQQTSDGGYIVTGATGSYGAGYGDLWLIKTDDSGSKVWERTFGGPGEDEGMSVQQTADGGYIITGYTSPSDTGHYDLRLIKTDKWGFQIWDKTFGGANNDLGYSVQQTTDGGYIVAGWTDSYGAGEEDVWLVKTDSLGNKVWDKTFGGPREDAGFSIQQTSDGGYIITGPTSSYGAGNNDVWLVKTDASGNEVWDKTFGGPYGDWGQSVQQTSDGGYIITGQTSTNGAGVDSVWLIKTDATGSKVWDKTFGGMGDAWGHSVHQTSDGGYIVTGTTASSSGGGAAVLLVKTDADGN
jgi:hypothetical protein